LIVVVVGVTARATRAVAASPLVEISGVPVLAHHLRFPPPPFRRRRRRQKRRRKPNGGRRPLPPLAPPPFAAFAARKKRSSSRRRRAHHHRHHLIKNFVSLALLLFCVKVELKKEI